MDDPFAEDALVVVNDRDARISVIKARMAAIALNTVKTRAGARQIVAGSLAANTFAEGNVFLMPFDDEVNAAGAPLCTVTTVALATTVPLGIFVVDVLQSATSATLILVGASPAIAIGQAVNFVGPLGTALHIEVDETKNEMLEAGPSVASIARKELQRIKGMPVQNDQIVGLGGPQVIAAAVASATTAASDKKRFQDITDLLDSFDNIGLLNRLFSPGHDTPDRGPAQSILMSAAKRAMADAFNSTMKDKISSALFVFSEAQLEALVMSRFGKAPNQISILDIIRFNADDKLPTSTLPSLTMIERRLRDLSLAWAVTHGPVAAAAMRAMGIAVRDALDLDEDQGTQFAEVIDFYLNIYHRVPAALPVATTRAQFVAQSYLITASTTAIMEYKAALVQKAIKSNQEAMVQLADSQAKSAFKVSPAPIFSHGATPNTKGGKKKGVVPTVSPASPKPAANAEKASLEVILAWRARRPPFLAQGVKVMCKVAATSGQPCNRPFCRGDDSYKAPDDTKHQQVVDWMRSSPFISKK